MVGVAQPEEKKALFKHYQNCYQMVIKCYLSQMGMEQQTG
mgnify:CR=1 FL=1